MFNIYLIPNFKIIIDSLFNLFIYFYILYYYYYLFIYFFIESFFLIINKNEKNKWITYIK
jgi:hypothetical protein